MRADAGERASSRRWSGWMTRGAVTRGALALLGALALALAPPGEAAANQLDRRAFAEAQRKIQEGLQSGSDADVAYGLTRLAEDNSQRAARIMMQTFPRMWESRRVYEACRELVLRADHPGAVRYLRQQALRASEWPLRIMLVDAIAEAQGEEAIDTLSQAVRDREERVGRAAARQLGALKTTAAIAALIESMEWVEERHGQGSVFSMCRNVLTGVLGPELDAAADYRSFFEGNKDSFIEGEGMPGASVHVKRRGSGSGTVTLFGQPILCQKVVIILDISGSMVIRDPYPRGQEPSGTRRRGAAPAWLEDPDRKRINRARDELLRVLDDLAKVGGEANIFLYSTYVVRWRDEGVHRLTPENLASARKFVEEEVRAHGTTATDEAIRQAYEYAPDADCFYLISDGLATHDGRTPIPTEAILDVIREQNRFRQVQINTLGFETHPGENVEGADRAQMMAIAELTGGTYTDIQ